MKTPDKKILIAFAAGLLAGWFLAFGAVHCRLRSERFDRSRMIERFRRELSLTPAQGGKVEKILEETRARIDSIRGEVRPRFEDIRRAADARIRAELTPEQLPKFEKLRQKMEERHRRRRGGPGEPGEPGGPRPE